MEDVALDLFQAELGSKVARLSVFNPLIFKVFEWISEELRRRGANDCILPKDRIRPPRLWFRRINVVGIENESWVYWCTKPPVTPTDLFMEKRIVDYSQFLLEWQTRRRRGWDWWGQSSQSLDIWASRINVTMSPEKQTWCEDKLWAVLLYWIGARAARLQIPRR